MKVPKCQTNFLADPNNSEKEKVSDTCRCMDKVVVGDGGGDGGVMEGG